MYQVDINKVDLFRLKSGKSLRALGIDPNMLVRIRKGKPTRAQTVKNLADALRCDVTDLLANGGDVDANAN